MGGNLCGGIGYSGLDVCCLGGNGLIGGDCNGRGGGFYNVSMLKGLFGNGLQWWK